MPRKKKPCLDCRRPTNGLRCQRCKGLASRKWQHKGDAQRDHHFRRKYGIDVETFELYWHAQHGKCEICKGYMVRPLKQRGQPLNTACVDHDHKTGKMRALLCSRCNKGLGFFEDDINRLERAKKYLEMA